MNDQRLVVLADRLEITDVLARFHRAIDGGLWSMMRDEVLAEDAVWEWRAWDDGGVAEDRAVGRDAVLAWLEAAMTGSTVRHFTTGHLFEIDGDRAHSESYMVVIDTQTLAILANGVVDADHVRTARGWRVRRCRIDERVADGQISATSKLLAS